MESVERRIASIAIDGPSAVRDESSYEELPANHIRLIHICHGSEEVVECIMETVSQDENPIYNALSYTWGDPRPEVYHQAESDTPSKIILIDGASKIVGDNLYSALVTLRGLSANTGNESWTQFPLWIDALCINQNDNDEKAAQVSRMDQVYKNASSVIAWLGDADEHSAMALRTLKWLSTIPETEYARHRLSSPEQIGLPTQDPHWTALGAFFCRSWFRRTWIIQEVALAERIRLLLGNNIIPQEVWRPTISYMLATGLWSKLRPAFVSLTPPKNVDREVPGFGVIPSALLGHLARVDDPTVAIMSARGSQASDARDHIYGIHGIANDIARRASKSISLPKVDYAAENTAQNVFTGWARLMVQEGKAYMILTMVEDRKWRRMDSLPSWVPDQSVTMMPSSLTLETNHWEPAGSRTHETEITCEDEAAVLHTVAARFDYVVAIAPTFSALKQSTRWSVILDFIKPLLEEDTPYDLPLEALGRTLSADTRNADPNSSNALTPGQLFVEMSIASETVLRPLQMATKYKQLLACDPAGKVVGSRLSSFLARPSNQQIQNQLREYELRMRRITTYRRLFLTSRYYLGIATESTEVGDEVWILPQTAAPLVMRPRGEDGSLSFVGETYVHGIMHGEATKWTDSDALEWTDITIS